MGKKGSANPMEAYRKQQKKLEAKKLKREKEKKKESSLVGRSANALRSEIQQIEKQETGQNRGKKRKAQLEAALNKQKLVKAETKQPVQPPPQAAFMPPSRGIVPGAPPPPPSGPPPRPPLPKGPVPESAKRLIKAPPPLPSEPAPAPPPPPEEDESDESDEGPNDEVLKRLEALRRSVAEQRARPSSPPIEDEETQVDARIQALRTNENPVAIQTSTFDEYDAEERHFADVQLRSLVPTALRTARRTVPTQQKRRTEVMAPAVVSVPRPTSFVSVPRPVAPTAANNDDNSDDYDKFMTEMKELGAL